MNRCFCKIERRSPLSRIYRNNKKKVFVVFHDDELKKIAKTNRATSNRGVQPWHGACIDSGAQKTFIGLPQAKAYCRYAGIPFRPIRNNNASHFGVGQKRSLGSIEIRIPTPGKSYLPVRVDVFSADIPLLLGLDWLDECGMYFNNVRNLLCFQNLYWEIPISRKLGHAYVEWKHLDSILFTRSELLRLHRGFQHAHQDKLLNLFRRARPAGLDLRTRSILGEISESCDTYQRLGPKPIRFKATLPSVDDIIFGEELSIDLMFIDSEAILHVVDTATFSAATFLKEYGKSVEGIWLAFIEAWCNIYTEHSNILRTDGRSVFSSPR